MRLPWAHQCIWSRLILKSEDLKLTNSDPKSIKINISNLRIQDTSISTPLTSVMQWWLAVSKAFPEKLCQNAKEIEMVNYLFTCQNLSLWSSLFAAVANQNSCAKSYGRRGVRSGGHLLVLCSHFFRSRKKSYFVSETTWKYFHNVSVAKWGTLKTGYIYLQYADIYKMSLICSGWHFIPFSKKMCSRKLHFCIQISQGAFTSCSDIPRST